jgi:hypothetical protein
VEIKLLYLSHSLSLGLTIDWAGLWSVRENINGPKVRYLWVCFNILFWQLSIRFTLKRYGISGLARDE